MSVPTSQLRRGGLLAALACLVFAAHATSAAGAVITFDDLAAPPRGGGSGLAVNTQYSGQGVTFNNPSALDFSQGGAAIPNFTHSGNVAVEPCYAIEFCTSPLRADFTNAQRLVRVWVGFTSALAAPLWVRLTAYDSGGAVVGTADATLPPNPNPTPIQTSLTVERPNASITRLEVAVTTGGGFNNGLAVDDVEFSTPGPPPPCPANGPPAVNVFQPPDGLTVQNNEFLLQGIVNPNGAPITSAQVVAQTQSLPRTAQVFPTLIDGDGGTFGPVRFNGLLAPGQNKVSVRATNCAGTGASPERIVNFNPVPSGTRFRQLYLIEVTQGIQDSNNSVPLVAAAANSAKRTFARVYLGLEGGAAEIVNVTGTLTAVRPDGTRPPGPLRVRSLNSIPVRASDTLQAARARVDAARAPTGSLNFELPMQWLAAGRLHLQLEHLEIEGTQSTLPCVGCENLGPGPTLGSTAPAFVNFHALPPLEVGLVSVPYLPTATATTPNVSRQLDIDMLTSWLGRAYPTSDVQITQLTMPTRPGPPGFVDEDTSDGDSSREGFLCDELNEDIAAFVGMQAAQRPQMRFYGLVSDAGGNFMRGCAAGIPGQIASGPTGPSPGRFSWDGDGSYADWYGGHELGHLFGRAHPGFCGETDDDDDYPFNGGVIGSPVFDFQGLDAGDASLGNRPDGTPRARFRLYDWREAWTDVMTYCDNEWLSGYTYRGILANLCDGDRPNCPDWQQLTRAGAARSSRVSARGRRAGQRLAVIGTLRLRTGRVSLAPLAVRRGLRLTPRPSRSEYAIVLRGAGGRRLARYPFAPAVQTDAPLARLTTALVNEVVAFRAATRRIEIAKGKRVLGAVRVSAHAPNVTLLSPNRGRLGRRVTVRWRSSDADGDRRTFTVLYSANGKRFVPVAAGLRRRNRLRVDLRKLPGGTRGRFLVIASDGVRTGSDRSNRRLRVPVKPPSVTVQTPAEGAELPPGVATPFFAAVTDLQDLSFGASRIVWRSSLQGELGRGAGIAPALNPGTHEITVTATNRGGRSASASLTVTVPSVPPVFNVQVGP